MSLLMDALKRAETSKQAAARGQPVHPAAGDPLRLEPLPAEPAKEAAHSPRDHVARYDATETDPARAVYPEARSLPPLARAAEMPRLNESREAVRKAFAAKQASEPPSRLPLWLALGTLGIAGVAIGGYVWYQMNALSPGTLASTALPPSRPVPAVAQTPPAIPSPPPAVPDAPDRPVADIASAGTATPLFSRREPRPNPAAENDGAAIVPPAPIRLIRSRPEPDANLVRGHADLERGDLDRARRDFEQASQHDPNNTDALLALAAIAQRQGRSADAENLRQRALIANPSDPSVQAATLSGAVAEADLQAAESRLKTLLTSQPESAALNFALGNLYSRQGRWSEAQQAYFNAVAADGDNPDYLFNLAVSLDHLRQPRLAAQHYRLALEAASKRPAAFDRDKVTQRLGELQPERQP